jgi:hypothetical protein
MDTHPGSLRPGEKVSDVQVYVSRVDTTYPLAHRTSITLQFQIYYHH